MPGESSKIYWIIRLQDIAVIIVDPELLALYLPDTLNTYLECHEEMWRVNFVERSQGINIIYFL